ncbi:MAG: hypothetical protein N2712_03280 [Brevinematales bacterium]|nr:hypothetical protein [Brevinematales bacterium]
MSNFLEIVNLILGSKITTFSSLKEFLAKNVSAKISKQELDILFKLIKRLYWGIFSDLNFDDYTELWKLLVIPDQKYPSLYGDIKKSIIIPNLYISLLDIHGYTAFCQKTRKNINSLHRLDRFVESTIKSTTKKYGVISRRERGDEVILVGADPVDIINATFDVVNLFSKSIKLSNVENGEEPFLPPFEISGGIVGGYSTTPLIISESGDVQGILMNLASRLQSRANSISPSKTKIVIDQSTYHKFLNSTKPRTNFVKTIKFLFNGEIEFKGGKLKVYEIYYRENENYKDYISQHVKKLTEAISRNEWQTNVISILADLGILVSDNMSKFSKSVEIYYDGEMRIFEVDNQFLSNTFMKIKYALSNSRDYKFVVEKMSLLVELLDRIDEFDQIVKDYLKVIYREFRKIFHEYEKLLLFHVKHTPLDFIDSSDFDIMNKFDSYKAAYSSVLDKIHSAPKSIQKRAIIMTRALNNVKNQIDFSIYSGKK